MIGACVRAMAVCLAVGGLFIVPASEAWAADGRKALVLLLHPYGMGGSWTTRYFRMGVLADRAAVLAPNGSRDPEGKRAWNASLACCNPSGPDDVTTLARLVEDRLLEGDIDPTRVYVWGYSNGAFMAWRLACARADLFRAVVLLGGSVGATADPPCTPSRPFDVLHVHGTDDGRVLYRTDGLVNGMPEPYRGVVSGSLQYEETVMRCVDPVVVPNYRAFDHDSFSQERETDAYAVLGCDARVEHWQMMHSTHVPALTPTWPLNLFAWSEGALH